MIEGFESYVGLMIVSEKVNDIERDLVDIVGVGMTLYKRSKGHGKRGIQS